MTLELSLKVFRYKTGQPPRYDTFHVQVPDTAHLLDALEAAWASHDRSLTFRHACHHASCGSCAVRLEGREVLPCITPLRAVWDGRRTLQVDPLRNFPVVSDLVVDVTGFFQRLAASDLPLTRPAEDHLPLSAEAIDPALHTQPVAPADDRPHDTRFENCIECGMCLSACPTMAAADAFFGPAGLAALHRARQQTRDPAQAARLLALADGEHGVWRCHSAWECTEVCPQAVFPAEAIMALRRDLLAHRVKRLFGR
jgi:succinate dehydrogenase / fumarate reductase iron-sulfur subunit